MLTVKSSAIPGRTDQGTGSNQYASRRRLSGAGDQPRVYAYGDMSIMTNYTTSGGPRANNYLAEVEPVHAGKTLQIDLFDPGDGVAGKFELQILDTDMGSLRDALTTSLVRRTWTRRPPIAR